MLKKLIAISVVLLVIAGLLAWQMYVSAAKFSGGNDLSKLQPAKDLKKQLVLEGGLPPLKPRRHYNPEEFGVIAAQNLFAETRNMQTELGGRRAQMKSVGDVYQGWTIVDITENQMVLASGDQKEIIPLFDTTKQRTPPGKTPAVATRVVSLGGGASSGSGVRAPGSQPPVAAQVGAPVVVAPVAAAVTGAQPATGPQGAAARSGQATPQGQPAPGFNERTDEQGRRIIRTPFGDIVRPERPPNN